MSTNHVTISGTITKDPELTFTQKGTAICKASIANNRKVGEKEETSFFDIVAWGRTGEGLALAKKGDPLIVTGRLRQETWEEKESGKKRSKVVVVAESASKILFAPKADSEAVSRAQRSSAPTQRQEPASAPPASQPPAEEDDVPF